MKKKASEYFDSQQSSMSELLHLLRQYNKTAEALYPYLSKEMQEHCVFSNIQDNIITYLTPLSAAANIVRFQIPEILLRIQQTTQFKYINKIQCKVMHAFKNRIELEAVVKKEMNFISEKSSKIIFENAQYIDDSELKDSLIRISKHTNHTLDAPRTCAISSKEKIPD